MMKAPRQILSLATAILLLVAGIAAAADERPVIGALLPLTGKQAALGNRVLDGLIAGIGLFDGKRAAPVALQIENYGSDPAAVSRSVAKLAGDPRVMAIVGPPEFEAAGEAAKAAQSAQVPLLAL
ncbi:MAG TPA: ABC transporter substrate-binding protein, partial [Syntrophales bacterium]|nr:ABC transporter substrate-binding protein [Syntrophales bacterium]